MSQIIHYQYKDDDSTYMMNNRLTGIIDAGVYRGFLPNGISGYTLSLIGDAYEILADGTEVTTMSVLKSPQGCIVKETGAISVELSANASASPRTDLIFCQHDYVPVAGGSVALYGVIRGTAGGGKPVLPAPKSQVVLCYITVPANWSGGNSGVTYEIADRPMFASNNNIARLDKEQVFTKQNKFLNLVTDYQVARRATAAEGGTGIVTADVLGANTYRLDPNAATGAITSFRLGITAGKVVRLIIPAAGFRITDNAVTEWGNGFKSTGESMWLNGPRVLTLIGLSGGTATKDSVFLTADIQRGANGSYLLNDTENCVTYVSALTATGYVDLLGAYTNIGNGGNNPIQLRNPLQANRPATFTDEVTMNLRANIQELLLNSLPAGQSTISTTAVRTLNVKDFGMYMLNVTIDKAVIQLASFTSDEQAEYAGKQLIFNINQAGDNSIIFRGVFADQPGDKIISGPCVLTLIYGTNGTGTFGWYLQSQKRTLDGKAWTHLGDMYPARAPQYNLETTGCDMVTGRFEDGGTGTPIYIDFTNTGMNSLGQRKARVGAELTINLQDLSSLSSSILTIRGIRTPQGDSTARQFTGAFIATFVYSYFSNYSTTEMNNFGWVLKSYIQ